MQWDLITASSMLWLGPQGMRIWACRKLGNQGNWRAANPLAFALVFDQDRIVKQEAAHALIQLGELAFDALIRYERHAPAADLLVRLGTPVVDRVMSQLFRAGSRVDIARILSRIGDPRAIEPLLTTLETTSEPSVNDVKRALEELLERVAPLLETRELEKLASARDPRVYQRGYLSAEQQYWRTASDSDTSGPEFDRRVDLSRVRELAEQELRRRGSA